MPREVIFNQENGTIVFGSQIYNVGEEPELFALSTKEAENFKTKLENQNIPYVLLTYRNAQNPNLKYGLAPRVKLKDNGDNTEIEFKGKKYRIGKRMIELDKFDIQSIQAQIDKDKYKILRHHNNQTNALDYYRIVKRKQALEMPTKTAQITPQSTPASLTSISRLVKQQPQKLPTGNMVGEKIKKEKDSVGNFKQEGTIASEVYALISFSYENSDSDSNKKELKEMFQKKVDKQDGNIFLKILDKEINKLSFDSSVKPSLFYMLGILRTTEILKRRTSQNQTPPLQLRKSN
ncbi:MAG: hypothetical protein Ta2D_11470 [Rickettsiales bacterium]|nr:MAG: hypothetical protein Ta2D_11470 [Rickettsiales bacterium]